MQSNPRGIDILKKKPLISNNLIVGRSFEENSLGKAYQEYMIKYGFNADERPNVRFQDDVDIAYVLVRYRQVHDFWHVLCDLPPSEMGEIALKWFEWGETGLPSCCLSAILGPLRLSMKDNRDLLMIYIPWAVRSASNSVELMSFSYEENLHVDIDIVRKQLNIERAPKIMMP